MRVCRHCNVRIEQEREPWGSGLLWVHVVRHGPHRWQEERYRTCRLDFTAEPYSVAPTAPQSAETRSVRVPGTPNPGESQ